MLQIRSIDKADLVEKDRSGVELRGSRIFEKEKKKSWKFKGEKWTMRVSSLRRINF